MNPDRAPPASNGDLDPLAASRRRIEELEARLQESDDTLEAIRRGDVDAVVVSGGATDHRVYTLENADRPYRVLIEQIQEGAVTLGRDGTVFYCNRRLAEMLDVPQERIIGQLMEVHVQPSDRPVLQRLLMAGRRDRVRAELALRAADGTDVPVQMSLSLLQGESEGDQLLCGVVADLTQQRLHVQALSEANARLVAEGKQREAVEDALRQSQKMEAVGQLTGGLAHDFNNLLTGIVGSLEMIRKRVAQGRIGDVERYVAAALTSADRAAALTHRLLAFSRRQTLDPKPVSVNRLVSGMEDLLQRTMGPAIAVTTRLADGLVSTLCDPNQLENALLNLAINARDAMPDGGRLTIETAAVDMEPEFAAARDMLRGSYVSIAVTDTGTGMTPDVVARAFDPFFTTKPLGLGTGLGLSMIYGFAKQSQGQVRIHSTPGLGTTVRLYLPAIALSEQAASRDDGVPDVPRAVMGETVLVVDDEPVVRMLVIDALQELGYAAIEAGDGGAGLRHIEAQGRIDLLVTDVGLPGGMNGRQLADLARLRRPGLKVLFITGFAENAVVGNGTMEPGMEVMTKPFAMDALATRIRSLIEG